MKPNCLFSRLDRLNYQNGYYRVQMGLTEDILGSASLFIRRSDWILNPDCCLSSVQFGWDIHSSDRAEHLPVGKGDREQPWLDISNRQLPNVCEEQ